MLFGKKTLLAASLAFFFASITPSLSAQDLKSVLAKLDAASANFHSTIANFEFDSSQTDPVPDTDVQKGIVYYDRKNNVMRMGIHIDEDNGKPVPKVIVVSGGEFQLYEKLINQVTRSKKAGKYESYLVLGFGASGKDLQQKFDVKYAGEETVGGVKTERLDLVAKDPDVLKLFPKITIWIDPARGVSLKQYFDEGQGQSRTCTYTNIKVNQPLPADAFALGTDSKTQFVNR
ncbi:outer-membrane lipoprotein carrier protein LolA [Telmatobacter sp. DSM 110680]|uniref:Outer-membrane lipoprotein carrier protein LolA n=1 Tax=Telmatobacter sp. DSM 110680 TaxID=3036704 RepID=A0AAU7DRZ3_9BACT